MTMTPQDGEWGSVSVPSRPSAPEAGQRPVHAVDGVAATRHVTFVISCWPRSEVHAATAALFLAALAFIHFREQPPERQVLRSTLAPPAKTSIVQFAVSPDGHYVVMVTSEGGLSVRA
jgi:hypothetical protein